MGQLGELDTDTKALTNRINAHAAFGTRNLEEWVFAELDVQPGQSILEIGCGTGKQTIPLARLISDQGRIRAVDIANDSLTLLRQQAERDGLLNRIDLVNSEFDNIENYLSEADEFDRAVACYSIYYANDPARVFSAIHAGLRTGGRFFFCGPAAANNEELKTFHNKLSRKRLPADATSFMEDQGLELAKKYFGTGKVSVSSFINPLTFSSSAALHDYWRSYNLYDPESDIAFREAANEHFNTNRTFVTNKRVFGVLAVK